MGSSAAKFKIDVQHLPPGFHPCRFAANRVGFSAYIWRGAVDGPVVLVNGATLPGHPTGDPVSGAAVLVVRPEDTRLVDASSALVSGTVLDNLRLGRPGATEAEVLAAMKVFSSVKS